MMTQKEFDGFIKEPRTVSGKIYDENKELFDEAEQQGRIRIKKDSSQITVGNTIHSHFDTYRIEPTNQ